MLKGGTEWWDLHMIKFQDQWLRQASSHFLDIKVLRMEYFGRKGGREGKKKITTASI